VGDKPVVMIFNKIDAYTYIEKEADDLSPETKENYSLDVWKKTWMNKMDGQAIFISATEKTNLQETRQLIYEEVKRIHAVRYPYNNYLY